MKCVTQSARNKMPKNQIMRWEVRPDICCLTQDVYDASAAHLDCTISNLRGKLHC